MVQFGKKKKITEYLYTKPVAIFLLIVFLFLAHSVYERFKVEREMAARRADAEQELEVLQERKNHIKAQVEYLEGERGIEEEVRKRFDVAKEGEQVVIILGEEEVLKETEIMPEEERKKWYQFWR